VHSLTTVQDVDVRLQVGLGVPVSSQYAVDHGEELASGGERRKVSRSTLTRPRPRCDPAHAARRYKSGVDVFVGASSRGGFSTNAMTRPSDVVGTTRIARVVDGMQGDRGLSAVVVMERPQRRDVEVGEHVTVHHEERLVEAKLGGGEANGAGGVEGSGSTA